jgi:transcriptional regulator with XRE-family HTH domain
VTTSSTGPLIPRRRLGAAFRDLRETKGETLQQTAKALMFSPSKLSRIENGLAGEPHPRDVRDLIVHFGLRNTDRENALDALAEQGRLPGWWQVAPYDMPSRLDTFISYESAASRIDAYVTGILPGLLQTRDYATEVLSRLAPWLDATAVALQVDIRMRRQNEYLNRHPRPRTLYAMPETVLRRAAGSPAVMRRQLDALIEASTDPLVELYVIPFSAGVYEAVEMSTTTVFTFDHPEDLDVVAIERDRFVQFLEKPESVRHYRDVITRLADHWLDRASSRSFIDEIGTTLWQERST